MTTPNQNDIAVIGAGSWGTALALLLARNQQSVRLWGHEPECMRTMQKERVNRVYLPDFPLPENIQVEVELSAALQDVRDVLIVVPSHAFRSVIARAKSLFCPDVRIVWGTKGLDPASNKTLDDVLQEIMGDTTPMAVLSGPSFAGEVAKGLPAAVTLACTDDTFSNDLVARFSNSYFRVYKSSDLKGVELCGVYKNVLAIGTGMSDGLELGANARSALITRGMAELARLLHAVNGAEETLLGLAGIGDTILTCTTDQSRNRRFGLAIGTGSSTDEAVKAIGQVVEGFINTEQLHGLAKSQHIEMPVVEAIYQVLQSEITPQQAAEKLMARSNQ